MKTIKFEVDDTDYEAIMGEIAEYQRADHAAFGETILPDDDEGEQGDLGGRIIAERMRGFRAAMAALDGASARATEASAVERLAVRLVLNETGDIRVYMECWADLRAAVAKAMGKGGTP